jgi:hypothetical protein
MLHLVSVRLVGGWFRAVSLYEQWFYRAFEVLDSVPRGTVGYRGGVEVKPKI